MAPLGGIVLSAGKKAALASLGLFTGVGGAVAYQLDQVSQKSKANIFSKFAVTRALIWIRSDQHSFESVDPDPIKRYKMKGKSLK